jgi:hypothetical protein
MTLGPFGLDEHLFEIVDDHIGKLRCPVLAADDGGDVVEFLRIGDRQDPPAVAGFEPDRLIIHAPIEQIGVASFREEVRGSG